MSSMVACDKGTSAAPNTPCISAKQYDFGKRLGRTAEHRREREAGERDQEQVLAAETRRKPADRRCHYCRGDDIGSQNPCDLVGRGGEGALDVWHRHVDDGGVERLHQGRRHDTDRDDRAVGGV